MKLKYLIYCSTALFLLFGACTTPKASNDLGLDIRLSDDSTAVIVDQIPVALLDEFGQMAAGDESWKQFFAVYEDAGNQEVQNRLAPLSGDYEISDRAVVFKPSLPFIRGKAYLVEVYAQNLQLDAMSMFKRKGWQMKQSPLEYKFRY